ncbi:hypothetical protein LDENG_00168350 [Lucifuga dentata]|nr:hypothetical protein LDENG_00168350 [Lucifuga dentata]
MSRLSPVKYGVPQGSIIRPLHFSLYISALGQIICNYSINFHCYADDTQLHVPLRVENYCHLSKLKACLVAVKNWMLTNFLLLNSDKTEMLVIGLTKHRHLYDRLNISLDNCSMTQSRTGKILGVIADTNLSFHAHISEVTKTAFFHLCNIANLRFCLFKADAETLIHASVSSRLDYCNVLFSGVALKSFRWFIMQLLELKQKLENLTALPLCHCCLLLLLLTHYPCIIVLHWLPVYA